MFQPYYFPPQKRFLHVAASLLALAGIVVSSLGIFVVPATTQDTSVVFPCMGGTCGCSSAAQCWQSCCCTTPIERLAWAAANDITPPESLLSLLAPLAECDAPVATGACCSDVAGKSARTAEPLSAEPLAIRIVLLSSMNRCQGLSGYIAIFGSAICEQIPDCRISELVRGDHIDVLDEQFDSPLRSPPTPPPRLVG